MLPNFICPGAQRSGTTTLYNLLYQHDKIYLPKVKETHFFDLEDRYKRGIEWYEDKYYSNFEEKRVVGDITPVYMYLQKVPSRIYKKLGKNVKFVFMLRNPVERAYSHYMVNYYWGKEERSFEDAIDSEREMISVSKENKRRYSYVSRGFYSEQIKRYLKYFPCQKLIFIIFEEFIKSQKENIAKILDFLELDTQSHINYGIRSNPTKKPVSKVFPSILESDPVSFLSHSFLSDKDRTKLKKKFKSLFGMKFRRPDLNLKLKKKLYRIYKEDIEELKEITDRDLKIWTNKFCN